MNTPKEQCYGIDVDGEGDVTVAEDIDGSPCVTGRYRADARGLSALKRHVSAGHLHRRICVRSSGTCALTVGLELIPLPLAEVMLVAPDALHGHGARRFVPAALATSEQRAQRLAVMARRML
jgi:hypothetical protein